MSIHYLSHFGLVDLVLLGKHFFFMSLRLLVINSIL